MIGGEGGLARDIQLSFPTSVAIDNNKLIVADMCNDRLVAMPLQAEPWLGLSGAGPLLPAAVFAGGNGRAALIDGPLLSATTPSPFGLSHDATRNRFLFGTGVRLPLPSSLRALEVHDLDGDFVGDTVDNCPLRFNPDQANSDADGIGDACDVCPLVDDPLQLDEDGDLIGDACDICPSVFDPDQSDLDNDLLGDACDLDIDGDGILNDVDLDDDNDGLADTLEQQLGLDPTNPDTDGDGIPDGQEVDPAAFRDCGADGLCSGDPGYPGPDLGEGDGVLDTIADTNGDGVGNWEDNPLGCASACPATDNLHPKKLWLVEATGELDYQFDWGDLPEVEWPNGAEQITRLTARFEVRWGLAWVATELGADFPEASERLLAIRLDNDPSEPLLRLSQVTIECQDGRGPSPDNGQELGPIVPCTAELTAKGEAIEYTVGILPTFGALYSQVHGTYGLLWGLTKSSYEGEGNNYTTDCPGCEGGCRDEPDPTCGNVRDWLDFFDGNVFGNGDHLRNPSLNCLDQATTPAADDPRTEIITLIPRHLLFSDEPFDLTAQGGPITTGPFDCDGDLAFMLGGVVFSPGASGQDASWRFDSIKFTPIYIKHPEDVRGNRGPESQFTFTAANPGVLGSVAQAPPPGVLKYKTNETELDNQLRSYLGTDTSPDPSLRWTTPMIGDHVDCGQAQAGKVEICWRKPWPQGRRDEGAGLRPGPRYTDLPLLNDDFGPKTVTMDLQNAEFRNLYGPSGLDFIQQEVRDANNNITTPGLRGDFVPVDEVTYEVFFPADATNHPLGPPSDGPNSYFYYVQVNPPTLVPTYGGPSPGVYAEWNVTRPDDGQPWIVEINFFELAARQQLLPFASISAHESEHDRFFRTQIWNDGPYLAILDLDGDLADDIWEFFNNCDEVDFDFGCWDGQSDVAAELAEAGYCQQNPLKTKIDFADPGPNINMTNGPCPVIGGSR